MDDAIATYREASEANEVDRLLGVLAPDAEVVSPISGRIRRIRPHLRPYLGTTLFAMALGLKVGVHPGVVFRALRG